jgi:acyl-CoA thioesterase I
MHFLSSSLHWLAATLACVILLRAQNPSSSASTPSRFITELRAGRPQHVVIYGTSLSKGGAWTPQLQAALDAQFPGLVKLTNRARGGQHSGWGAANVDAAVVALKP